MARRAARRRRNCCIRTGSRPAGQGRGILAELARDPRDVLGEVGVPGHVRRQIALQRQPIGQGAGLIAGLLLGEADKEACDRIGRIGGQGGGEGRLRLLLDAALRRKNQGGAVARLQLRIAIAEAEAPGRRHWPHRPAGASPSGLRQARARRRDRWAPSRPPPASPASAARRRRNRRDPGPADPAGPAIRDADRVRRRQAAAPTAMATISSGVGALASWNFGASARARMRRSISICAARAWVFVQDARAPRRG